MSNRVLSEWERTPAEQAKIDRRNAAITIWATIIAATLLVTVNQLAT